MCMQPVFLKQEASEEEEEGGGGWLHTLGRLFFKWRNVLRDPELLKFPVFQLLCKVNQREIIFDLFLIQTKAFVTYKP